MAISVEWIAALAYPIAIRLGLIGRLKAAQLWAGCRSRSGAGDAAGGVGRALSVFLVADVHLRLGVLVLWGAGGGGGDCDGCARARRGMAFAAVRPRERVPDNVIGGAPYRNELRSDKLKIALKYGSVFVPGGAGTSDAHKMAEASAWVHRPVAAQAVQRRTPGPYFVPLPVQRRATSRQDNRARLLRLRAERRVPTTRQGVSISNPRKKPKRCRDKPASTWMRSASRRQRRSMGVPLRSMRSA
jgi:hypothetical protein